MLPPVLEIVVIWHPRDEEGAALANMLFDHFHGTAFSGLIGGAIELYVRSAGWRSETDAPRPLPLPGCQHPAGVANPHVVAVVPLMGIEMAAAVQQSDSPWHGYLREIADCAKQHPTRVGVFPYAMDLAAIYDTELGKIMQAPQRVAAVAPMPSDTLDQLLCRELAQGIAQLLIGGAARLTIFISHTKRHSRGEGDTVDALIGEVRQVIGSTRLQEFFDAADLQVGKDWDATLRDRAASSALLAIRTDLYPSREWCQREMLIAKCQGMPVVILDALGAGEERGSFLMDHVPRAPARTLDDKWDRADIYRCLDIIVNQCLKRELWRLQEKLAGDSLGVAVDWWAPHAPELVTLLKWLRERHVEPEGDDLIVIHPDPPLGPEEKELLQQQVAVAGIKRNLVVMTPRMLAARSA